MTILVTGAAGFIGSAVALQLISNGMQVIGIDNLNNYYDIKLKKDRLSRLQQNALFTFKILDIVNRASIEQLFNDFKITTVIHLAAQAGVRYSIENPNAYIDTNLVGFANLLEACRQHPIKHFVFASSSSVYGDNKKTSFSEEDPTDSPLSLYAATKKSNELMARSYAHLYRLPCTGLRFFTVYGPWGRPDMAPFYFTHNILAEIPIIVFNNGNMMRDFTYIDDIVEGIFRIIHRTPDTNPPFRIYNLGNHAPIKLTYFIELLEKTIGKKAIIDMKPKHSADAQNTCADINAFEATFGKLPHTSIEVGISKFIAWYKHYYEKQYALI